MGLMRECEKCHQVKELRGGFHYDRDRKRYSKVCKECEANEMLRVKELCEKANLRSYIQKSWKKLCPMMDEKECDQQLYHLRQIYDENKNDK